LNAASRYLMHSCQPLNLAVAAILRHNLLQPTGAFYTRREVCENLPVCIPTMCSSTAHCCCSCCLSEMCWMLCRACS